MKGETVNPSTWIKPWADQDWLGVDAPRSKYKIGNSMYTSTVFAPLSQERLHPQASWASVESPQQRTTPQQAAQCHLPTQLSTITSTHAKLLTANASPPAAFSFLSPSTCPFSTSLPSTTMWTSLADRRLRPAVALLQTGQASSLRDMSTRILSPFVHCHGHALLYRRS